MSHAASTVAIHLALARRAERRLVAHLRSAGALSAPAAVALSPQDGRKHRHALRRLQREGVVHEADGGRLWLDEAAGRALAERRRRGSLIGLTVLVVLMALLIGIVAVAA